MGYSKIKVQLVSSAVSELSRLTGLNLSHLVFSLISETDSNSKKRQKEDLIEMSTYRLMKNKSTLIESSPEYLLEKTGNAA